ncbi:hypothetical protein, partial [Citrobacter youngae]|uniref:hypothetical protein n=1 Tax=Citrobacter youngae TaxID=133448 RepID=UPI003979669B
RQSVGPSEIWLDINHHRMFEAIYLGQLIALSGPSAKSACPHCARSGRFRSQLFLKADALSNRILCFQQPISCSDGSPPFSRVISVVAGAECPLMQSQLRLSDSPGTAATIHWQHLLSHRTILPWRKVAQVLRD